MILDFAIIIAVVGTGFVVALLIGRYHLGTLEDEARAARLKLERALAHEGCIASQPGMQADSRNVAAPGSTDTAPSPEALLVGRAYNDCVVRYRNAANTFPVVLTVPRERRSAFELYEPACRPAPAAGSTHGDGGETGAHKRIMNPYMLWAAGMADVPLEDEKDETPARRQ